MSERTVRTATVPLPGGRELRAALWPRDGERAGRLVMAVGWPEDGVPAPSDQISVPADALPDLRAALAELEED